MAKSPNPKPHQIGRSTIKAFRWQDDQGTIFVAVQDFERYKDSPANPDNLKSEI